MVGHMNKFLSLVAGLFAGFIACATGLAQQALPDPTRPPAGLQPATGTGSLPVPTETLVLQSVLLGHGRTPAAVISGQLVPLGGSLGEHTLARVDTRSVQLRGPQGLTTLTLVPEGVKHARTRGTETMK
jgi:MSHA biogenesis protein MshK